MKTLKAVEPKKIVIWSLVAVFSFLQIVPTGWAANAPADELEAQSVPASVAALTEAPAVVTQPIPEPKQPASLDSVAFLLNDRPFSKNDTPKVMPKAEEPKVDLLPKPKTSPVGQIPVDEKEAAEAKGFLKKTPATKSTVSLCTTSIPAYCSDSTSYYDAKGKLIGQKRVSWTEGGDTTQVEWYRPKRNGELVLVTSYVEKREIEVRTPPEVAAVKADLLKNLGIDARTLEAWIKQGLVRIIVGEIPNTIRVEFDRFLKGSFDALRNVNFFDPTGQAGMPLSIEYQYAVNTSLEPVDCLEGKECSGTIGGSEIILLSAQMTFENGRGVAVYEHGVLKQVDWYRSYGIDEPQPMIACQVGDFTCGMVFERTVTYDHTVSIPEDPNPAHLLVTVTYHDGRAVSKLEFEIGKLADGKDHILNIREYGKDGTLHATSEFKYLIATAEIICVAGSKCVPPPAVVLLDSIVRTDADGKRLSEIALGRFKVTEQACFAFGDCPQEFLPAALITLPNGSSREVTYASVAELLDLAREFEQENTTPPAVQAYVNGLKNQLGTGFLVTVTLQEDGSYLVHVGTVSICSGGALCPEMVLLGGFSSMEFSLTADGVLNRDSIKAYYNDRDVDGSLLYAALEQLYPPPQLTPMPCIGEGCVTHPVVNWEAWKAMTQITVTSVDTSGAIHFKKDGILYKTYRNADGTVVLEEENAVPPAVQAYVDGLKNQLGTGFLVTATLQEDGTYLITVADGNVYVTAPTAGLKEMSFSLGELSVCMNPGGCPSGDFVLVPSSLRAVYYSASGDIKVDAQLLYEAMGVCPAGQVCTAQAITPIEMLKRMAELNVTEVDQDGVIHFTENGIDYKCYRDDNGKVIVEPYLVKSGIPVKTL